MKKHHHFERRNTKAILISALAAATVVGFTGCANEGELPSMPMTTLESTYFTETQKSAEAFSAQTAQTSGAPLETTAQPLETTEQKPAATTAETSAETTTETVKPEPVVHTERTEEYEDISYDTRYEYSDRYYKGTLQTKQTASSKGPP